MIRENEKVTSRIELLHDFSKRFDMKCLISPCLEVERWYREGSEDDRGEVESRADGGISVR